jgi:hypothetical protein
MAYQIQPIVKTKTLTEDITNIIVSVSDVILGQSAMVNTVFQNETRVVYTASDILSDEDYLNWGSDDKYIINWVCQKYNLTLI